MKNKKRKIGTGLAVAGALGLAGSAVAAGPPQRIGLHPIDSGHWEAGAGLPDATGDGRQALVRVVDGSDAHPEAAAITGLRGADTGDVDRLGFTVAGDEAGIIPCIKVAFTDALGTRREVMITTREMRGQPGAEAGWTQYTFDPGLPPGGTIEAIELGAHVEQNPPDIRPSLRFDNVVVNDEVFTGPADNAAVDQPDT